MAKEKKTHSLQVSLMADKSVLPAGKPGERILEITLTAPAAAADRLRLPLNLALVIDRSGSMHGEKLHYVKAAAAHVIDLLSAEDRAAVVIYDNQVETILSSRIMDERAKREAKGKIREIHSGGSTYLYGGWLTGCRQVAEAIGETTFNRTLLLTDGLANVGVRDVGAISVHAQELFTRNVSTSCFGVGRDYDEHMLESIANHGGGNFHFLETLNAIPLVFEREFEEIISVVLKDIRVALTLPPQAEAKVSANWRSERTGDQLTIFLGAMVGEQKQSVYLRLTHLIGLDGGEVKIPVRVTGLDLEQKEHTIESVLTFTTVPEAEEADAVQDPDLMSRFALVDLADQANEALKRERAGDRKSASDLVMSSINLYQSKVDQQTLDKYHLMADEMRAGYDDIERKRRHYQEYQSKRGYRSIRDYRLSFTAGVPLAEIEGKSVLINTAASTSIAEKPEWLFLNEVNKFPQEADGLTCQGLSTALGTRVDVMLGMDILRDLHLRIDPVHGVIQFSQYPFRSSGVRLPLKIKNVPPTAQLEWGDDPVFMRLVTVLKLNYFPAGMMVGLNKVGEASDGLPAGLTFTTAIYKAHLPLGSHGLTLDGGVIPDVLRDSLGLGPGEGVLGADLLQSLPLTLAFPDREMILYI